MNFPTTRFIIFVLTGLLGTAGVSFAQTLQYENNVVIKVGLLGHTDTTKPAKLVGVDRLRGFSTGGFSQEQKAKKMVITTLSIFLALAVIVTFIVKRRAISEIFSSGWQRSKLCRIWVFFSCAWAMGVLLFILLLEPYGPRLHDDEVFKLLSIMFVPQFFLGAVWFGYQRFVR